MKNLVKNIFIYGSVALVFSVLPLVALADKQRPDSEPGGDDISYSEPIVECRDILTSYRRYVGEPQSDLSAEVVAAVQGELKKDGTCEDKVAAIEKIFNAYWATEPWCLKDRQKFSERYDTAVASSLTAEARTVVAELLKQGGLTCSETLTAAVTIVRFYNPSFNLYDVMPEGGLDGTILSSVGVVSTVFDAQQEAGERKRRRSLKSCRAQVKRLKKASGK